jgi:hypothetical protein
MDAARSYYDYVEEKQAAAAAAAAAGESALGAHPERRLPGDADQVVGQGSYKKLQ